MNTKLTLKLEDNIIKKAKGYAEKNGRSLSELVENYFRVLTENDKNQNLPYSKIVEELTGVIKLKRNFDEKKEYSDYLLKKYNT